MRVLIDLSLTPDWCKLLGTRQHEAFHWSQIGPKTASALEILEYARYSSLCLMTANPDIVSLVPAEIGWPRIYLLRGELLTPDTRGLDVLNVIRNSRKIQSPVITLDWSSDPGGLTVTYSSSRVSSVVSATPGEK